MNLSQIPHVLALLVMASLLVCPVVSDNEPVNMVILTADSSVITHDENDTYVITLHEVNSNATMSDENQTLWTIPLEAAIPTETNSAAIVLSGTDGNESIFMGYVSYAKYFADLKSLSMNLTPMKYYDGTILQRFIDNKIGVYAGNFSTTSIHIESKIPVPTNNNEYCVGEFIDGVCMRNCYELDPVSVSWILVSQSPC